MNYPLIIAGLFLMMLGSIEGFRKAAVDRYKSMNYLDTTVLILVGSAIGCFLCMFLLGMYR